MCERDLKDNAKDGGENRMKYEKMYRHMEPVAEPHVLHFLGPEHMGA